MSHRLALAMGLVGCVMVAASCTSHRVPCTNANRQTVLSAALRPQVPSASFVVAKGATVGVRLTDNSPNTPGPLGNIGPLANIYFTRAGHRPDLHRADDGVLDSADPRADISHVMRWVDVRLPAGHWSAYATDGGLAIEVSTCER